MEMIRNCSHGSEIATYLTGSSSSFKYIVKVATTLSGIKNLEREIEGWNWYQKMRYQQDSGPLLRVVRRASGYLKVEIKFIDGVKIDYRRGLERNAVMVKRVLEHYCEIWPKSPGNASALHGDFSLDNVICNSDGIHIIDWEHFNPSAAPWGFDALYLLFETLYFGIRNRRLPSQAEIDIICSVINFLYGNSRLGIPAIKAPLRFTKDFIIGNPALWGDQLKAFPDKFPVLMFTDDRVDMIDRMIFPKLNKNI